MSAERRAISQSAVWKARTGDPYGMIPEANNAGAPLYVSKAGAGPPETPMGAWHLLMARWERWQHEDEDG